MMIVDINIKINNS